MKRERRRKKSTGAGEMKTISRRTFRRWKQQSQERDRELLASGKVPPEQALLLRPERLKGATVVWSEGPLIDDPTKPEQKPARTSGRQKQTRPVTTPIAAKMKSGLGLLAADAPSVLILGSFPSEESLRSQQYYANPKNQFWRLMEAIVGIDPLQPYQQRVQAITAKGIALWDVLHACERDGSLDNKIKGGSAVTNNIKELVDQMPSIKMIALNGGAAANTTCSRQALLTMDEALRGIEAADDLPAVTRQERDSAGRVLSERDLQTHRNQWDVQRSGDSKEKTEQREEAQARRSVAVDRQFARERPEGYGELLVLQGARLFAEERIKDEVQRSEFVNAVREQLAKVLDRGDIVPVPQLRERTREPARTSARTLS